jgi:hypothetical protein
MESRITAAEAHNRFESVRTLRSLRSIVLYQLVHIVGEHQPVGYKRLYELALKEGVSTRDGKPLANASYYHVLCAAKILGLVSQPGSSKSYHLTPSGKAFLTQVDGTKHEVASSNFNNGLRQTVANIVKSNVVINHAFFWLFRGPDNAHLLEFALPVTFVPSRITEHNTKDSRLKTRKMAWKLISQFCEPLILDTVETQSIVLGLRQWCIELGLLDELVVPTTSAPPNESSQVVFPVNQLTTLTNEEFSQKFLTHFWSQAKHTANYWSANVPELLYSLCPSENIAVETAKLYLQRWMEDNRRHITVTVFSPSIAMSVWTRRPLDYASMLRLYVQQNDSYVSHIIIFDDAIPERGSGVTK